MYIGSVPHHLHTQMFLVAQAAGLQAEFKDAVGSWDAIRDACSAWHAAQPTTPTDVVKVEVCACLVHVQE